MVQYLVTNENLLTIKRGNSGMGHHIFDVGCRRGGLLYHVQRRDDQVHGEAPRPTLRIDLVRGAGGALPCPNSPRVSVAGKTHETSFRTGQFGSIPIWMRKCPARVGNAYGYAQRRISEVAWRGCKRADSIHFGADRREIPFEPEATPPATACKSSTFVDVCAQSTPPAAARRRGGRHLSRASFDGARRPGEGT